MPLRMCFVAPSLQDNLPNTVMEAPQLRHHRAFAFDVGGMPDLIEHRGHRLPSLALTRSRIWQRAWNGYAATATGSEHCRPARREKRC
jgi:hypothetical protein